MDVSIGTMNYIKKKLEEREFLFNKIKINKILPTSKISKNGFYALYIFL